MMRPRHQPPNPATTPAPSFESLARTRPRMAPTTKHKERVNQPAQLGVYCLKNTLNKKSERMKVIATVAPMQMTGLKKGFPNKPMKKPATMIMAPR